MCDHQCRDRRSPSSSARAAQSRCCRNWPRNSRTRAFPEGADVRRFFQIFTLLWALYFFVKAAFYYYLGLVMPLTEAIALRSIIGSVSLGLMILLSVTQGRRLFDALPPVGMAAGRRA